MKIARWLAALSVVCLAMPAGADDLVLTCRKLSGSANVGPAVTVQIDRARREVRVLGIADIERFQLDGWSDEAITFGRKPEAGVTLRGLYRLGERNLHLTTLSSQPFDPEKTPLWGSLACGRDSS